MKTITLCGVLFVWLIIGTTSCKHDAYEAKIVNYDTNTTNTQVDTPSFRGDIFPIFQTSCASAGGCHNTTSQRAGYEFSSYETSVAKGIVKGKAEDSKIYQTIITTDPTRLMPPGAPLLPKQKELVRDWINTGAPDN
ncbi:MAG: c-type cytochrome domain-containing protein [Flavipsychrobacter sp.]